MNVSDISLYNLFYAFIFIALMIVIFNVKKIRLSKILAYSTFRMTLQLILVGYILSYIFDKPSPYITLLILGITETFAILNAIKRLKIKNKMMKKITAISIISGSVVVIFYFLLAVIKITPWYNPQFFIPIAGMVIGNTMTGVTLAIKTYMTGFKDNKELVNGSLMIGASPKAATQFIAKEAIDNALLPSLNKMFGMGIVFLPGMMTGQILSGISPNTAIIYQIVIMLASFSSNAISVILISEIAHMAFFNNRAQIIDICLLYTSPSPRDKRQSRMPSSA